jgi:hypothetical protein
MGYAKTTQTGHGIHQRLRSRAFIIAEPPTTTTTTGAFPEEEFVAAAREVEGQERSRLRWQFSSPKETEQVPTPSRVSHIDPEKTICFVSMDAGMVCWTDGHAFRLHCMYTNHSPCLFFQGSDLLNTRVLARLDELLPQQANSGKRLCHLENLSIRYAIWVVFLYYSFPVGFQPHVLCSSLFVSCVQWYAYTLRKCWVHPIHSLSNHICRIFRGGNGCLRRRNCPIHIAVSEREW